jgi:ABC-type uncharacterized transport system substrate-binding protein
MGQFARRHSRRQVLRVSLVGLGLLAGCGMRAPWVPGPTHSPRVGLLAPYSRALSARPPSLYPASAFGEGLEALGWIDGQTYIGDWRYSEGKAERLPELAAELVQLDVDVLVTLGGTPAAGAAKQATRSIPIVMIAVGDPVELGLDFHALYGRAVYYVDRILRGAKPADLPVEQPREFDFVIDLRTAQAHGLTIPRSVLQQATEVIQ